jgi:hypothetical protein
MVWWCRCDSWTRPLRRLREFRVNPLEAIDRQAKMERAFDQWVRPIIHEIGSHAYVQSHTSNHT